MLPDENILDCSIHYKAYSFKMFTGTHDMVEVVERSLDLPMYLRSKYS